MPEKAVYSLTGAGEKQFEKLMMEISSKPLRIFLDFNAVIVNLTELAPEKREICLGQIGESVKTLKAYLEENMKIKENIPDIPETGKAVLRQQMILVQAIETWLNSLKGSFEEQ